MGANAIREFLSIVVLRQRWFTFAALWDRLYDPLPDVKRLGINGVDDARRSRAFSVRSVQRLAAKASIINPVPPPDT